MTDEPSPEQIIDIGGPRGETLFYEAKEWLLSGAECDLQAELDALWEHYRDVTDERLLALVACLCLEQSVDALVGAFAPGFDKCSHDQGFTSSVKIGVARSFRVLPSRILTACDLVRSIRNEFAHNLQLNEFAQLDPEKYLRKLAPYVHAYNRAARDVNDHQKLFRDLVGFTLVALAAYTRQVRRLREYMETENGREGFKAWIEQITGDTTPTQQST